MIVSFFNHAPRGIVNNTDAFKSLESDLKDCIALKEHATARSIQRDLDNCHYGTLQIRDGHLLRIETFEGQWFMSLLDGTTSMRDKFIAIDFSDSNPATTAAKDWAAKNPGYANYSTWVGYTGKNGNIKIDRSLAELLMAPQTEEDYLYVYMGASACAFVFRSATVAAHYAVRNGDSVVYSANCCGYVVENSEKKRLQGETQTHFLALFDSPAIAGTACATLAHWDGVESVRQLTNDECREGDHLVEIHCRVKNEYDIASNIPIRLGGTIPLQ